MPHSIPFYYRCSRTSVTCPALLTPVGLATLYPWLEKEHVHQLFLSQQRAAQSPPIAYSGEKTPLHILDGSSPPWMQDAYLSRPPAVIQQIALNDYAARQLSAVKFLTKSVDEAMKSAGMKRLTHVGGLWAQFVDGVDPDSPEFLVHCLHAEHYLVSDIVEGSRAAESIAKQIVEHMRPVEID